MKRRTIIGGMTPREIKEWEKKVDNRPLCRDPERLRQHRLGTDPSCHTCAMSFGADGEFIDSEERQPHNRYEGSPE